MLYWKQMNYEAGPEVKWKSDKEYECKKDKNVQQYRG